MRRLTGLLFVLMLASAAYYWQRPQALQMTQSGLLQLMPVPAPKPLAGLRIEQVFGDLKLDRPLFLTAAPSEPDHVYIATQPGLIHRVALRQPGTAEVFRDLRARIRAGGEEGLLGLAFDPDYARNGSFYVYYSPVEMPRRTVLVRLQKDSAEATTLLEISQPYANHNGGWIGFGPDGMLYVGVGDGGSGHDPQNRAQDLSELLGKILRVTRDGKAPPDNPFVGRKGARPELWAYGLRNPWRNSFDRATGELWVADVGQNEIEEIDVVTRGGNYGWRLYEGGREDVNPEQVPASGFAAPVTTYDHRYGCSVIGGYVYRGRSVPAAVGKYFYSDFCSGRVWMLDRAGSGVRTAQFAAVPIPTSFGEDAAGELYITSFDGHIYQLKP